MSANTQSVGSGTTPPWIEKEVKVFAAYLRSEKKSESTVNSYSRSLKEFLSFVGKPVSSLTKKDMRAWMADIAEDYCENSMIPKIAAVNHYTDRVHERPELKLRAPPAVEKDIIPMTEAEVKLILEEAGKPQKGRKRYPGSSGLCLRDQAAVCLIFYGGLRASEVANLRMSGLDLERKRIRVHAGKGKNYSLVNLTDEAVAYVKDYIEHGRPQPAPGFEDLVMLSYNGKRLGRNILWTMIKRTAFRVGIEKNVYPHLFRHSMITHMAEKGLSASLIKEQSRQKKLDTVQRYIHHSEPVVRQAYDKAFGPEKPEQPERPVPPEPQPSRQPDPESINPETFRDRILLKYLDGEISDEKLEKLLSLIDQQPQKERKDGRERVPGYF